MSKVHTTNYVNTFIEIADDCKADMGTTPPTKQEKTVANLQFDMIFNQPYTFTSDDVLFTVYAQRNNIAEVELPTARAAFFAKGQPCFSASPLTKTYGWGVHFDQDAKMAIFAKGSQRYDELKNDKSLKQLKAMKTSK